MLCMQGMQLQKGKQSRYVAFERISWKEEAGYLGSLYWNDYNADYSDRYSDSDTNQQLGGIRYEDSIIQGIGFLQQFEWIVDDRCVKTIEELENYTYQKDRQTNEYINKPVDSYNHCIDAIRYAVEPINGSGAPKAVGMRNIFI